MKKLNEWLWGDTPEFEKEIFWAFMGPIFLGAFCLFVILVLVLIWMTG